MALSHPAIGLLTEYSVPIFLGIGFIIIIVIIVDRFGGSDSSDVPSYMDYEKESLKEMFDKKVRKEVVRRGRKVDTPFYEGKYKQGHVYKELKRTEADKPIKISAKRGGSDDADTEEVKDIRIWLIGNNSSRTGKIKDKVSNRIRKAVGKEDERDIFILSDSVIKSESEDRIVLENGVDWSYDPDISAWITVGTAEGNVKKRVVMDKTLNKMLEEFPNYVEKANKVNPAHNMNVETEEAKKKKDDDPGV